MSYSPYKIQLTDHQRTKLRKAIDTTTPVRMRLNLSQLTSNEGIDLLLSKTQINRIKKAIQNSKGVVLSLTTTQIRYNKKHGGFLPALIPIGIAAASAIASAVATYGANKALQAIDKSIEKGKKKKGKGLSSPGVPITYGGECISGETGNYAQCYDGQGLTPLGTPINYGGEGLAPLGTPINYRNPNVYKIPGTDIVVKTSGNGLFKEGIKKH